jgi:hypothetical protein
LPVSLNGHLESMLCTYDHQLRRFRHIFRDNID